MFVHSKGKIQVFKRDIRLEKLAYETEVCSYLTRFFTISVTKNVVIFIVNPDLSERRYKDTSDTPKFHQKVRI